MALELPDHDETESSGCAQRLIEWMRGLSDCTLESGLSDEDLARAEAEFQIVFPPTWKEVLSEIHPISLPMPPRNKDGIARRARYPDWRLRAIDETREIVEAPVVGVLFDVELNGFWWRAWGAMPEDVDERLAVATSQLETTPRLVPIRGHWYLASAEDSPVFSIVQTDLWCPALTLCDVPAGTDESDLPVEDYPLGAVPFWSDLHAWSQIGHMSRFGDLALTNPNESGDQ